MRCARDGRVVATAATLPYGGRSPGSAWCWSRASNRRHGLGTRLLHRCIADLTAAGLVPVLDATPAGRPVYRALGFEDTWGYHRLARQQRASTTPRTATGAIVHPIADADWPALCAYDAAAFGADRSARCSRGCAGACRPPNLFAARDGRIVGLPARPRRPHRVAARPADRGG